MRPRQTAPRAKPSSSPHHPERARTHVARSERPHHQPRSRAQPGPSAALEETEHERLYHEGRGPHSATRYRVRLTGEFVPNGGSLAALEWRRGCQAEAELAWLLKQHGLTPQTGTSLISRLRQGIGAALVHAGQRLASGPRGSVPETGPALQGADPGDPSVIPALVATSASRP